MAPSPGPWAARTQTPRHGGASPRGVRQAPGPPLTTAGVQARERVPTYLSSAVRMTSTPYPANCASCPESYYSVCPVQGTKGPCDRGAQQCPAQGGPALPRPPPPPPRPALGHLLLPLPPYHLAKGLSPLAQAGGAASHSPPPRPADVGQPTPWARGSWLGLRERFSLASTKVATPTLVVSGEGSQSHPGTEPDPGGLRRGGFTGKMLTPGPTPLKAGKPWPRGRGRDVLVEPERGGKKGLRSSWPGGLG